MKTRSADFVIGKTFGRAVWLALIIILMALLRPAAPAIAQANFMVNSTLDGHDGNVTDGLCDTGSADIPPGLTGICTLRAAIEQANALAAADTIDVPAGLYILELGQLVIDDDLTITGEEENSTIIDGNGTDRVIEIERFEVNILNVTIRNGNANGAGGGVFSSAEPLNLTNVTVSDNIASGSGGGLFVNRENTLQNVTIHNNTAGLNGGGIRIEGNVTIRDGIITGNTAQGRGGGLHEDEGDALLSNVVVNDNIAGGEGGGLASTGDAILIMHNGSISGNSATEGGGAANGNAELLIGEVVISGNTATQDGGGILNRDEGRVGLANLTISGNSAGNFGGGIFNRGEFGEQFISLNYVTVAENTAISGGGIATESGEFEFGSTILAVNTATSGDGPNCSGTFNSHGFNLVDNEFTIAFDPSTGPLFAHAGPCTILGRFLDDMYGESADLRPLQDNGGDTLTHALLSGSPAIDAADPAACPNTDQRGVTRPQGGACDIGAYELEELPEILVVEIDIKPGDEPNTINCRNANGVITVAILTTNTFDALSVDHTTVFFEGAGEIHRHQNTGEPIRHEEDVDGDGDLDLIFHFRLGETFLTCDSTEGVLAGETFEGQAFEGTDQVRMIKPGPPVPVISVISGQQAVVSWTTELPTTGEVFYGTQPGVYTQSAIHPAYSLSHQILLTGLTPFTTYYYQVRIEYESGENFDSFENSFVSQVSLYIPVIKR